LKTIIVKVFEAFFGHGMTDEEEAEKGKELADKIVNETEEVVNKGKKLADKIPDKIVNETKEVEEKVVEEAKEIVEEVEEKAKEKAEEKAEKKEVEEKAKKAGEKIAGEVAEEAKKAGEKIAEEAKKVAEKAQEAKEEKAEKAEEKEEAEEKAEEAAEIVGEAAGDFVADEAKDVAGKIVKQFKEAEVAGEVDTLLQTQRAVQSRRRYATAMLFQHGRASKHASTPHRTSHHAAMACLAQKTQAPTGKALRSSDRVWLHMMHSDLGVSYLYEPVLISLQEAFEEAGATAVITDDTHNNSAVLMGVRKAVAEGHQPLVVGIALPWSDDKEFLRTLSEAGAYVVFYQTEPLPNFKETVEFMAMSGAKELWDFSRANLAYFEKHMSEKKQKAKFKTRYMPPGYARGLDFGVDLESSDQSKSSIGFLGHWTYRPKSVKKKYHKLLGASLHSETHALTFKAQKTYLSKYPMQLNTHKDQNCCPSNNVMESLRMAVLLSNKACVISAPADRLDEDYWKGVVHFASIEETPALQKRLQGDLKACRQKSYETFRACYSVGRILEQSGFLDVWPRTRTNFAPLSPLL